MILNPYILSPSEQLIYAGDIGRTSGGLVSGWNDETTLGISNTGGTAFNVVTGTFRKLGVIQPAPEAVYRQCRYTVGTSQSYDFPNFTAGVEHLVRLHCWCDGGTITSLWTMDIEVDGVVLGNDVVFNIALDGAIVFEFYHTPASSTVNIVLTKVDTAAILSGIEVIKNPGPRPHNNVISGYGDSLMWGSDASDQYHLNPTYQTWELLPQNWSHFNLGLPGWRLDTLILDYSSTVSPVYDPDAPNSVLFINGGVNDIFNNRATNDIIDDYQALCSMAQTEGWLVVLSPIAICSDSYPGKPVDYDSKRDTVNAHMKDNWGTCADYFIDLTADPFLGDAGDPDDPTYINDGLHYTDAGYALWADYMVDGITAIT